MPPLFCSFSCSIEKKISFFFALFLHNNTPIKYKLSIFSGLPLYLCSLTVCQIPPPYFCLIQHDRSRSTHPAS